jgi:hypothetical protein
MLSEININQRFFYSNHEKKMSFHKSYLRQRKTCKEYKVKLEENNYYL